MTIFGGYAKRTLSLGVVTQRVVTSPSSLTPTLNVKCAIDAYVMRAPREESFPERHGGRVEGEMDVVESG